MADRSIKKPKGVVYDVLVKVDKFVFPVDFVVLDCESYVEILVILGRPFLATSTLVYVDSGELKFQVNDEVVNFNIHKLMKYPSDMQVVCHLDQIDKVVASIGSAAYCKEPLGQVLLNYDQDEISNYDEVVAALVGLGSHNSFQDKLDLDLSSREAPPAKPSIIEPPKLELKDFPPHLKYVLLGANNTLPVIIACHLKQWKVDLLIIVLKRHIKALEW